ncbi:MAG: GDSL-type esterase/lipase family protein [Gammaproteobacteria bacterium]
MPNNNSNVFERHPKKTLAILLFIFFLLLDFGGAAALKLLGLFEPSYINSQTLEAAYRRADPVFHHGLKENAVQDQAEWGGYYYRVQTNSLGFKDRRVREIALQSRAPRLVFIGDSFTEGVGIAYEQTFVGLIDAQLAAQNIEVLNAAATSYSPIIYLRKVEHLLDDVGLKFDHLVVFVDLSDIEDEALGYRFDAQRNVVSRNSIDNVGQTTVKETERPFSLKEFFTEYTLISGRLRNLASYLKQQKRSWRDSLNQRRGRWTLDEAIYAQYGATGLTLAQQHMSELKHVLDRHQIDMTLAVYPWPDQIYARDYPNRHTRAWQAWAQHHGVAFMDLFPAFLQADAEQTIQDLFIIGDVHWNDKGHAVVAEEFLKTFQFKEHRAIKPEP